MLLLEENKKQKLKTKQMAHNKLWSKQNKYGFIIIIWFERWIAINRKDIVILLSANSMSDVNIAAALIDGNELWTAITILLCYQINGNM